MVTEWADATQRTARNGEAVPQTGQVLNCDGRQVLSRFAKALVKTNKHDVELEYLTGRSRIREQFWNTLKWAAGIYLARYPFAELRYSLEALAGQETLISMNLLTGGWAISISVSGVLGAKVLRQRSELNRLVKRNKKLEKKIERLR